MQTKVSQTTTQELISQGIQLKQANKLDESISTFHRAIELDAESYKAYHGLGEALTQQGKLEAAAEAYRQAIAINADYYWSYHCLGQVLFWQNKLEEAIAVSEKAIQLNPHNIDFYKQLAKSYAKNNMPDKSLECYQQALKIDSQHHELYFLIGHIFAEKNDYDSAAAYYRKSLEIKPDLSLASQHLEQVLKLKSSSLYSIVEQLFDAQYYRSQIGDLSVQDTDLIDHYLQTGWQHNFNPNRLFDGQYYLAQNSQISLLQQNPLLHYVESGWKLDSNPHPLFDTKFYRQQIQRNDVIPLYHYLVLKGFTQFSPHPAFDLEYYSTQFSNFDPQKEPAIIHFLKCSNKERQAPNPAFNPQWYLANNPDIAEHGLCPNFHYLTAGYRELHRPIHNFFSQEYLYNLFPNYSFKDLTAWQFYQAQKVYRRRRILLVGHEASRTGAPLILLRIAQDISKMENVEVFTILCRGGDILGEYKKCSHVYVTNNNWGADFAEIREFLAFLRYNPPLFAIANSSESRHVSKSLNNLGIPVCSLIHEIADHYPASEWNQIYQASKKVIYPSNFVAKRANKKVPEPLNKIKVLGQGLLRDNFGKYGRQNARKEVIEELGFPEDTCIIMGCGTMDYRKGIDLFVGAAKQTIYQLNNLENKQNIRFIWVGQYIKGSDNSSPSYWALKEVKNEGLEKLIIHVPPTKDVEKYFLAADIFLLTSRSDPFPCVVHEAMAASLPVVYFQNSGGAAELVENKAGIAVPYGNTMMMADALVSLISNSQQRHHLGKTGETIIRRDYQFNDYTQKIVNLMCKEVGVEADFISTQNHQQNQKKTIYFFSSDWGVSGVNTLLIYLVKQLINKGFDAKILFTRGRYADLPQTESLLPDVPYIFLQPENDNSRSIWLKLIEFFQDHDPCIIVPNYDYVASSLSPIIPDHIGIVGVAHSNDVEHYEHVYRLGLYWNKIIAVSNYIKNKIIEYNQSFANKTVTVYNGVPVPKTIDERQNNNSKKVNIIYSGRIVHHQKRVERYIEIVNLLLERQVDFTLTMVGEGDQLPSLQAEFAPLIDRNIVNLPGRVSIEKVNEYFSQSDIFLLLSDFEGLPVSLLEAMVNGCIPLVTDIKSSIPEIINHGENGFICSKHNLTEFVDVIESLANNPKKRSEISNNVLNSVETYKLRDIDMSEEYVKVFEHVFAEISQDKYSREKSLSYGIDFSGVIPPVWLQF